MSRTATLRALTYSINMMESHDVMTISCSDYFITMLKEARDLIREKPVKAIKVSGYWAACEGCGEHFRIFMMAGKKAKYCPNCGKRVEYEHHHDAGAADG